MTYLVATRKSTTLRTGVSATLVPPSTSSLFFSLPGLPSGSRHTISVVPDEGTTSRIDDGDSRRVGSSSLP